MTQESDFRGLLYEPTNEEEVLILFSLLIPYLTDSFIIDYFSGAFPDCRARRKRQEIGIEFEFLASHFFEHNHDQNKKLKTCNMIVCWKNNLRRRTVSKGGVEFLNVKGHEIEILDLHKIVDKLQKEKSLKFIHDGERPRLDKANEKRFFEQLKENVDEKKFSWINELYQHVSNREEFKVEWGQGKKWFTMRFYVKKWDVDPIGVQADGNVWITYQGNPAIFPWELPQEVQTTLRQMFKHQKGKWLTASLNTQTDLDNIKRALEILAEHSKHSDLIWHELPR